jgi:WD40 repeat protein
MSYPGFAVVDSQLNPVTTIGVQFGDLLAWVDDSHLAVYSIDAPPLSMRVWDINTGAFTRSSFEFPRYWVPFGISMVHWGAVFSPDLQLAAYTHGDPVAEGVTLWDIAEAKPIWSIDRWSAESIAPAWDPAGQRLAVPAVDNPHTLELFIVDRSGHSRQWANARIEPSIDGALFGVSWSPSGRYIAFAMGGRHPLLILDTEARELIQYCVAVDVFAGDLRWSPSSSHLIVPQGYGSGFQVIDPSDGSSFPLFNEPSLVPVAWLP